MISFVCGWCKTAIVPDLRERPVRPWVYLTCVKEVGCSGFGTTLRVDDAIRATFGTIEPSNANVFIEVESYMGDGNRRIYVLRPVKWKYHILLEVKERDEDRALQIFNDQNPNAFPCPECQKLMAVFHVPGSLRTDIFHRKPECESFARKDPAYKEQVLAADRAKRAKTQAEGRV